jgi:hypothetical protein
MTGETMMTQALDSRILLALAVKLKKIFEQNDKFLSFAPGLGFSYDYLEFMEDPTKTSLSAAEQLNFKGDFARLMNIVPQDSAVFSQDASQFLWDSFRQVLINCEFPSSGLTPDEEQQLAQAQDYLTDDRVTEDNLVIPVNSPAVTRYYEYKTAYEEAERTYLDEQFTVQYATGEEGERLRQQWETSRKHTLLVRKTQAEQDWLNLGFKRQVEAAQALKNKLEIKKYLNLYSEACLDELEISEIADLNGQGVGFYTTFFSPSDAFDPDLAWTSIHLTRTEIEALIQSAPPELKSRFDTGVPDPELESISLEYNDVVVIRPWFKQEFFQSRFWRLEGNAVVSDGQVPRQGKIPAYITSLIVARNVQIRRRTKPGQASGNTTQKVSPGDLVRLTAVTPLPRPVLDSLPSRVTLRPIPPVSPPVGGHPGVKATIAKSVQAMPLHAQPGLVRTMGRTNIQTSSLPVAPITAKTSFVRPASTLQSAVVAQTAVRSIPQQMYAQLKYEGLTIRTPRSNFDPPAAPPATSNPAVTTETLNLDGVSVLALVCKRLPKAPDPDLSLPW